MSLVINLFSAFPGFGNYAPTEFDALRLRFEADPSSNNLRLVFRGAIQDFDVTIIVSGQFQVSTSGMTFETLQALNESATVSRQDIYRNGILILTIKYLDPISMKQLDASTFSELSKIYSGDDVIYAQPVLSKEDNIIFLGYDGNDRFYAYGSTEFGDIFHGGDGVDSLIYSSSVNNYSITASTSIWNPMTEKAESAGYFIRDNTGRDGDVQVSEVERLIFSDSAIAFDISGTAGQAYRIYEAVLGRAPDLVGLGYWIHDMDNGVSLTTIASGFIASKEFKDKYGTNPSFDTYVNLLYQNILGRAPDDKGLNYWVSNMQKGIDTPAAVLASFSEGFENTLNVAPDISQGIYYTPWVT
jgi:Domain of unknown function (DUF4214)